MSRSNKIARGFVGVALIVLSVMLVNCSGISREHSVEAAPIRASTSAPTPVVVAAIESAVDTDDPPTATSLPPTAIPPTVTPLPPTPIALAPAPMLPGRLVTQTLHFDIYRLKGGLTPKELLTLAPQFEEALTRVAARMESPLTGRVAISFEPPQRGPCAIRGITFSHERRIHLYYAPDTPPQTTLAIVAHELAHELQHDRYGWEAHRQSDIILLEGQATWASGEFALGADGRPVWANRAIQALAEDRLLPLNTNLEADCRTGTRNSAYTGWASFVDFLITTYGRERFDAVYQTGRGRDPGSSDYAGIYGKSITELDAEWRTWLQRQ